MVVEVYNCVLSNGFSKLIISTKKLTCRIATFLFVGVGQVCSGFGGFFASLQMFIYLYCCGKLFPAFHLRKRDFFSVFKPFSKVIITVHIYREKEKPLKITTGNKEESRHGLLWNSVMELE